MSIQEHAGECVVVTEVSSFVGYHVACWLAERGFDVIGTIDEVWSRCEGVRRRRLDSAAASGVRITRLELTDAEQVRLLAEAERPQVWIHHAGMTIGSTTLQYDLEAGHLLNVLPLQSIYENLKRNGCAGVIVTGSGEEYSMLPSLCFEEDPCWPLTPYGLSKLSGTIRAFQLSQQYKLPTRVARLFIPYGSLDEPEMLLPAVMKSLKEGKDIALSSGLQRHDYIYIDDICRCYELLIDDLRGREAMFDIFNVCGGEGVTQRKLLLEVARLLDADPSLLAFGRKGPSPGEPLLRAGSNDKAKGLLRWKPRPFCEGLACYVKMGEI